MVSRRYHYECLYVTTAVVGTVEAIERVDEHVYALILPLVASADAHEHGVIRNRCPRHGRCHADELPAGFLALCRIFLVGRSEARLKSVGRHHIHSTSEKLATLLSGDFADRRKHVGALRGNLLKRVTGYDIEFPCLGISVVAVERIIERQVVAGDAAPDYSRMGRKDRRNRKPGTLNIKKSCSSHPLVELRHDLVGRIEVVLVEALYDLSGGVAEERRLPVVPVSGEGIHAETLPIFRQNLVLRGDELLEVHEYGNRLPRHVPLSDSHAESFRSSCCLPGLEQ